MSHYWLNDGQHDREIARFVVEDDPFGWKEVVRGARDILKRLTRSASWGPQSSFASAQVLALEGEQAEKNILLTTMVNAVYLRLVEAFNLRYEFEKAFDGVRGQWVRSPEEVGQDGCGTCLDLAVLFLSCLAKAKLWPIYVHLRPDGSGRADDHSIAGTWLVEPDEGRDVFIEKEAILADLRRNPEDRRFLFVDATGFVEGYPYRQDKLPFEEARSVAERLIKEHSVVFALDVRRAWEEGERPEITSSGGNDLLERALEVCRMREHGPKIEVRSASGPFERYAMITRTAGVGYETYTLAVLPCCPDLESLELYEKEILPAADARARPCLVYFGDEDAPENLVRHAWGMGIEVVSFPEYQGLIPLESYVEKQCARLAGDPDYPQENYVHQRLVWSEGDGEHESDDAVDRISSWLLDPYGQFVVVHGDSGAGKTFALRELARRLGKDWNCRRPAPALVEMRSLGKARSLDQLLAQHFIASLRKFDWDVFWYMLRDGRILLLFDGFDELAFRLPRSEALAHFEPLLEAYAARAKVVVTIRTQHFPSEAEILEILRDRGQRHRIVRLCNFDENQIRSYLTKLLGSAEQADRRLRLIGEVGDLLALASNPRMLGFIVRLSEDELRAAASHGAAAVYLNLIDNWLESEVERAHPRGLEHGLDKEQLLEAVSELALLLWDRRERTIAPEDRNLDMVLDQMARDELPTDAADFQMKSGSLLVRDETNRFRFIHDSIIEYLIGRRAAREIANPSSEPRALTVSAPTELMTDAFLLEVGADSKLFEELGRSRRDLLRLCASFGPHEIPRTLLSNPPPDLPDYLADVVSDEGTFETAVRRLQKLNSARSTKDGVFIYPLVRRLVLEKMPPPERVKWSLHALEFVVARLPSDPERSEGWSDCAGLLPLVLAAAGRAAEEGASERAAPIFDLIGRHEFALGEFDTAAAILEQAVSAGGKISDLWSAVWLNNLAAAKVAGGNAEGAVGHLEKALAIDGQCLAGDHLHLVGAYVNLGRAEASAGSPDAAVPHLQRAADLVRMASMPHVSLAKALDVLGAEFLDLGRFEEAVHCLRDAEEMASRLESAEAEDEPPNPEEGHPRTAIRHWMLARGLEEMGRGEEADEQRASAAIAWERASATLMWAAGDEARSMGVVLRGDIDGGVRNRPQLRRDLRELAALIESKASDLARDHQMLSDERSQLLAAGRGVDEMEGWGESSILKEQKLDFETDADAADRVVREMADRLDRTRRVAAAWREVIDVFVVRCVLRAHSCGLHPDDCVLLRDPVAPSHLLDR